ncbi:hypothetical protein ACRYI5_01830 [Furfurilactobacillus sp. WILCCON 0119]
MFNVNEARSKRANKQLAVKQTVETYFATIGRNMDAKNLTELFCTESFFRFNGHERAGQAAILEMIQSFLINPQTLVTMTIDVPTFDLVALVHGQVLIHGIDNEPEPYNFTMTLISDCLIKHQNNKRWQIHRLNYQRF